MTAKELDTMVNAMRKYTEVKARADVQDTIWNIYKGLLAIDRNELAKELWELYCEIDYIDTHEIMEIGTFRK